jgi:glycosyltransferase involved in cell wall biosynthesis
MSITTERIADVGLILEGTYPYVFGGVSSWVHDLLLAQKDFTFHLISIMPQGADTTPRFQVPGNVVGLTQVTLPETLPGASRIKRSEVIFARIEAPLARLFSTGDLGDLRALMAALSPFRGQVGSRILLNSRQAWKLLLEMYRSGPREASFIDFFWSWRAMAGGLYALVLPELPPARAYHAVSTGYAGLMAARARVETGRPALLTEHGIYSNERRIEIAMSDWLYESPSETLAPARTRRELKDLWIDAFVSYSRVCYQACSKIITLYEANQQFQIQDGAPVEKLEVIPNGIDFETYSRIERDRTLRPPTVALIGRVVPIKDVKTYIRAAALLKKSVPDLKALVLGPTDEDREYFEECQDMVRHLGLEETVLFKGKVKLTDYLGCVDALALTSISEAQPLVILEAGAAGVPTVATNVGACEGMILGRPNESPALGPGGAVTPLSNPAATARALEKLLTDPDWRERCGRAIRERVRRYYNKVDLDEAYRRLYRRYCAEPDAGESIPKAS